MIPFSSVVPGTTSTLMPAAPKPNKRVLQRDVYDTLELMALAFKGIGGGVDYRGDCPLCVHGLAREAKPTVERIRGDKWVHVPCPASSYPENNKINEALENAGISRMTNDEAVAAINRRLGRPEDARVTFKRWCRELGVVRGEAA